MNRVNFCYWLQGYFEIANPKGISKEELKMIKSHLQLTFKNDIDLEYGDKSHQKKLSELHWEGRDIPSVSFNC